MTNHQKYETVTGTHHDTDATNHHDRTPMTLSLLRLTSA